MEKEKEVKELLKKGKQKGYVTHEEIHEIFPEDSSHLEVENLLAQLEEMKIAVVDNPVVATEPEPSYYIEDPVKIYLKEISQIPLLTAQEEIELGKEIKTGEDEIVTMEKDLHLSSDKVRILFKEWKGGALRQADLPPSLKNMSNDELERTALQIELLQDKVRQAKRKFTEANLRLVVNVAKKYASDKLSFLDLINEGNLGLMRAVDKFNYQSGYRFSTYAIWWIRQSIIRALADKGRMIRLPVPIIEMINKCMKVTRELSYELGREPAWEEIAARMELPVSKIIEIVNTAEDAQSLETPHGFESEGELGDYVENKESLSPTGATFLKMLRQSLEELLEGLSQREQVVLRLRYGLEGGKPYILEEIGKRLGVTRERARQIEVAAIQKLRHKKISTALRDFLIE
ncbi:MAG: sigma-70 family RNA polymerase sigma factor [bacterium]